ncbi:hypothetical protein PHMEG_00014868 [Phytophthora megakarya]|uniref:Uncharacterized protein n=1 Tax=Phytophthora megakarya TaxID=4795 RepID=A0A225W3S2_9STRA|nr:hypothetical protein PHMEG_00014868 [Phytophthora megakarya]
MTRSVKHTSIYSIGSDQINAILHLFLITVIMPSVKEGAGDFKGFKDPVTELHKNLKGVQQFQWFAMDASRPGVVLCEKGAHSEHEKQDLRRKVDGLVTDSTKVTCMFDHFLEPLPESSLKAKKLFTTHHTVQA